MRNRFLGLDADDWDAADGLPAWSDMVGGPITVEVVKAGIVEMLRRLNEDAHRQRWGDE